MKRYEPHLEYLPARPDLGIDAEHPVALVAERADGQLCLAADVAPLVALAERLLPEFEKRLALAVRNRPDLPEPDELNLIVRFSVADLRAAVEVLRA